MFTPHWGSDVNISSGDWPATPTASKAVIEKALISEIVRKIRLAFVMFGILYLDGHSAEYNGNIKKYLKGFVQVGHGKHMNPNSSMFQVHPNLL
jgi:hypothetical protein